MVVCVFVEGRNWVKVVCVCRYTGVQEIHDFKPSQSSYFVVF